MGKLRETLKKEDGSSMILALVFLLLCLFTGGSVLAAASANAGRLHRTSQAERNWRSAMALMAGMLGNSEETTLQLTIRDVTVIRKNGTVKRTVRYLATGGDTVLQELLIARAAAEYEAANGIPDSRELVVNGKERDFPDISGEASGSLLLTLDLPVLDAPEELTAQYAFSGEGDLSITLEGDSSLVLTLACGTGRESSQTMTADGITSQVHTAVRYWEGPVIGKGGSDGET